MKLSMRLVTVCLLTLAGLGSGGCAGETAPAEDPDDEPAPTIVVDTAKPAGKNADAKGDEGRACLRCIPR